MLCAACGGRARHACGACLRAWYCDKTCQRKHWEAHACVTVDGDLAVRMRDVALAPGADPALLTAGSVVTLPKGLLLFHGTVQQFPAKDLRQWSFFSTNVNPPCGLIGENASKATDDPCRVMEFTLKRDLSMVVTLTKPDRAEPESASGTDGVFHPFDEKRKVGEEELRLVPQSLEVSDLTNVFTFDGSWVRFMRTYIVDGKLEACEGCVFPYDSSYVPSELFARARSMNVELSFRESEDRVLSYDLLRQFDGARATSQARHATYGLIRHGVTRHTPGAYDAKAMHTVVAFDELAPRDTMDDVTTLPTEKQLSGDAGRRALAIATWRIAKGLPRSFSLPIDSLVVVYGIGGISGDDRGDEATRLLLDVFLAFLEEGGGIRHRVFGYEAFPLSLLQQQHHADPAIVLPSGLAKIGFWPRMWMKSAAERDFLSAEETVELLRAAEERAKTAGSEWALRGARWHAGRALRKASMPQDSSVLRHVLSSPILHKAYEDVLPKLLVLTDTSHMIALGDLVASEPTLSLIDYLFAVWTSSHAMSDEVVAVFDKLLPKLTEKDIELASKISVHAVVQFADRSPDRKITELIYRTPVSGQAGVGEFTAYVFGLAAALGDEGLANVRALAVSDGAWEHMLIALSEEERVPFAGIMRMAIAMSRLDLIKLIGKLTRSGNIKGPFGRAVIKHALRYVDGRERVADLVSNMLASSARTSDVAQRRTIGAVRSVFGVDPLLRVDLVKGAGEAAARAAMNNARVRGYRVHWRKDPPLISDPVAKARYGLTDGDLRGAFAIEREDRDDVMRDDIEARVLSINKHGYEGMELLVRRHKKLVRAMDIAAAFHVGARARERPQTRRLLAVGPRAAW